MGTVYLFAPDACKRRISMLPEVPKGLSMAESGQLTLTIAKLRDKKINCIYVGAEYAISAEEEPRIVVPGLKNKFSCDGKLFVLAEIIGTMLEYDKERYDCNEDKPAADPMIVKPPRHPPCLHCYYGWRATDDNILQALRNLKRDGMTDNYLIVTHAKVAAAFCDLFPLVFDTPVIAAFDEDGLMAIPLTRKTKTKPVPVCEPVEVLEPATV